MEPGHALQFRPGWPEHLANEACGSPCGRAPVPGALPGAPFLTLGGRKVMGGPLQPGSRVASVRGAQSAEPRSWRGGSAWPPGDFKK